MLDAATEAVSLMPGTIWKSETTFAQAMRDLARANNEWQEAQLAAVGDESEKSEPIEGRWIRPGSRPRFHFFVLGDVNAVCGVSMGAQMDARGPKTGNLPPENHRCRDCDGWVIERSIAG